MVILTCIVCACAIAVAGVTQCKVYNSNSTVKLTQRIVEASGTWITIPLELNEVSSKEIRVRVCIYDMDTNSSAGCKLCVIKPYSLGDEFKFSGYTTGHTYQLEIDTASCD